MHISQHQGHLTYCSNIHPGESWEATFAALKKNLPEIKARLNQNKFGIGLRLSNEASLELIKPENLAEFKIWLADENCYVFTMNGFPYGGFHHVVVKDKVHEPDWLSADRLEYAKRLFLILAELLPEGMDGGVSTSPISYKPWHKDLASQKNAMEFAAKKMAELALFLAEIKARTGKSLHLDIEPEPDGVLETGDEFIDFYTNYLLKYGLKSIQDQSSNAEEIIREHIQLCFDVCHFAVGFEDPRESVDKILANKIKIGRIQISAALTTGLIGDAEHRKELALQLARFDEPTYLHQAIIKQKDGTFKRFGDLGPALAEFENKDFLELRTHFHVPVFTQTYGELHSTQSAIVETLNYWKELNFTNHLEVETYTWDVLPAALQTDIVSSIVRELEWIKEVLA